MVKRFEKNSREFEMFGEFYKLCQKHWINDGTDMYYGGLVADCEDFCDRFAEVAFAKHLVMALLNFAEDGQYPTKN